jgi:hypothetical protein
MSTFLTLQQELAAQCGMDQTVSSDAVLLKRWLNNSQQAICRAFEWPFMKNPTPLVIQTVLDYTTGTVATIAGNTTITFSATIAQSKTGFYIQTSDSKDFYRITSHTAGTNTATLEIGAIFTNPTATYSIRQYFYSVDSTVDKIIAISQDVLPYMLVETSYEYFQAYNPGFLSSGTPRLYCTSGVDANGFPQFRLWPNPDSVINLTVWYQKLPIDMVADTDVSPIPAKWHTTTLIDGALVQAYRFLVDDRVDNSVAMFEGGIEEMKSEYETSMHRHRVMTAADNQPVGGQLGYMPLPFNYPRNS